MKSIPLINPRAHHATAQVVSCWLLTVEARVHSQGSPHRIWDGQGSKIFLHVFQFVPVSIIPSWLHTYSYIMWDMNNGKISGCSSTETGSPHHNNNKKTWATAYWNAPNLWKNALKLTETIFPSTKVIFWQPAWQAEKYVLLSRPHIGLNLVLSQLQVALQSSSNVVYLKAKYDQ